MSAGANTVLGVVERVGSGFALLISRVNDGVAWIAEKLSSITFGDVSKRVAAMAADMAKNRKKSRRDVFISATSLVKLGMIVLLPWLPHMRAQPTPVNRRAGYKSVLPLGMRYS